MTDVVSSQIKELTGKFTVAHIMKTYGVGWGWEVVFTHQIRFSA
jgi:hypothetical protein